MTRDFFLDHYTDYRGDKAVLVRGTSDRPTDIITAEIPEAKRPAAFWFVWHNCNRGRPLFRLLAVVLFGLGFLALGTVLYQNAMTVWRLS